MKNSSCRTKIVLTLFVLPTLVISVFTGCETYPHSEGREDYIESIESHSAGDKQFSGLYNNFEFRSTVLTRDVSRTIHKRMQKYYDWDATTADQKWQERQKDMEEKTSLWLSFFTPESKDDNLANKVSIWKIYLDANGTRYEGRARKANNNLSEAKALFPYHTRWATAYYVDFPIPTDELESRNLKLVITGPLGRREAHFR